jgi:hypothetical protein
MFNINDSFCDKIDVDTKSDVELNDCSSSCTINSVEDMQHLKPAAKTLCNVGKSQFSVTSPSKRSNSNISVLSFNNRSPREKKHMARRQEVDEFQEELLKAKKIDLDLKRQETEKN